MRVEEEQLKEAKARGQNEKSKVKKCLSEQVKCEESVKCFKNEGNNSSTRCRGRELI